MDAPRFDFALPPVDPTTVAPDGTPRVYVAGTSPQARHCSQKAAESLQAGRGAKTSAYLTLMREEGPMHDHAAARCLGVPLSSICSIRNGINEQQRRTKRGPWLAPCGEVLGMYGKDVTVWQIRDDGGR